MANIFRICTLYPRFHREVSDYSILNGAMGMQRFLHSMMRIYSQILKVLSNRSDDLTESSYSRLGNLWIKNQQGGQLNVWTFVYGIRIAVSYIPAFQVVVTSSKYMIASSRVLCFDRTACHPMIRVGKSA
jgi:hypothetical protein